MPANVVPPSPPAAVRMMYVFDTELPKANCAFTVAPVSVAVPETLVLAAADDVTCTK
jgi:hypothetical protein